MATEINLNKARLNVALVWGKDGISHYRDELGFEFEFLEHTGETEEALWGSSKSVLKQAYRSVQTALDVLDNALAEYPHLAHATNFYLSTLKEYWLMNLTFDGCFDSALDSIVEDAYDSFRMRGATFEESEAKAELCEKESEQFLSEHNAGVLFERIIISLAGESA